MTVNYQEPVSPDQVAAIDNLLAPEFAIGDWQMIEAGVTAFYEGAGLGDRY